FPRTSSPGPTLLQEGLQESRRLLRFVGRQGNALAVPNPRWCQDPSPNGVLCPFGIIVHWGYRFNSCDGRVPVEYDDRLSLSHPRQVFGEAISELRDSGVLHDAIIARTRRIANRGVWPTTFFLWK